MGDVVAAGDIVVVVENIPDLRVAKGDTWTLDKIEGRLAYLKNPTGKMTIPSNLIRSKRGYLEMQSEAAEDNKKEVLGQIKGSISKAMNRSRKPFEETEDEYIKRRIKSDVVRYERAIEQKKNEIANLSSRVGNRKRSLEQATLKYWEMHLEKLNEGADHRIFEGYIKDYQAMLKKAISSGQEVPEDIIKQRPEYRTAANARARYEKGLHTSFANRSIAINDTMQSTRGYKVKRQDGKSITDNQMAEIAVGVDAVEDQVGQVYDLFDKTNITIAHTSGKYPFLKVAGGLYSSEERTVTMGISGVNALAHELGHWLDYESGAVQGVETIASGLKKRFMISATSEGYDKESQYVRDLINTAYYKMSDTQTANYYFKKKAIKGMTEEEKEELEKVKVHLGVYWRRPREIWARLFEQYVATKAGIKTEAAEEPEYYQNTAGYWSREEFEAMMPEIEGVIQNRIAVLRGTKEMPIKREYKQEVKVTTEEINESVKKADEWLEKVVTGLSEVREENKELLFKKSMLNINDKRYRSGDITKEQYTMMAEKYGLTEVERDRVEKVEAKIEEIKETPMEVSKTKEESQKEWNPELHFGITRKRAIDLGEDKEYPRGSAAVFHFDKLTPEEKLTVIEYKEKTLLELEQERKDLFKRAKESAATARALHVDPNVMNPFPKMKKSNQESIEGIKKQIEDFKKRAKTEQKEKVKLRILPDSTLWITQEGGHENNVASWNPPHRPDMTEKSWVGGYIMGMKVSDNARDWLKKVGDKYDLNSEYIVAESWHGGGMRHNASPYEFVLNMRTVDTEVEPTERKLRVLTKGDLIDMIMGHTKVKKGTKNYGENVKALSVLHMYELRGVLNDLEKEKTSLKELQEDRTERSQSSDERQLHSVVIEADDPKIEIWKKNPGKMDVRGIDTPTKKKKEKKVETSIKRVR